MRKMITFSVFLLFWGNSFSQKITTHRYPESKGITAKLKQEINYNIVQEFEGPYPNHETPDFHGVIPFLYDKPSYDAKEIISAPGGISSPPPCLSYQGLNDAERFWTGFPPDVNGAVGISYSMITQNGGVKIQDLSSGGILYLSSLGGFFGPVSANKPYDPRVVYDPFVNRWIVICADEPNNVILSRLLIAVSQTSDPGGAWNFFSILSGIGTWLDYPTLGFNKNWIVVSGNMMNSIGVQTSVSIFAINKAAAYSGTLQYTRFDVNGSGSTIQPAISYDNNANVEWLCNNWNGSQNGIGAIRLYEIQGTPSSPSFISSFFPSVNSTWNSGTQVLNLFGCTGTSGYPGHDVMDSRIRSLVFQAGYLWAVQKVGLPTNSPIRAAVQWWQINPANGGVTQFGRIDDNSGNNSYVNPSLAVNNNGDVLVGYSHLSPNAYPTSAYSFRYTTDPAGVLKPTYDYKTSTRIDCRTDPGPQGKSRFGDYSSTILDINGFNLWTLQEYFPNGSGAGSWWSLSCVVPNCTPVLNLNTPISISGVNIKHEVSNYITGSSSVNTTNGYVKFDAANYIELNPGFITDIISGYFKAYIDGCGGVERTATGGLRRTEEVDSFPPNHDIILPEFKVYPNPANEILYINIPDKPDQILKIELWDAIGRKMSAKSNLPIQSSLDILSLPKGVYFLRILTQKKEYKTKFAKE
jgi:hypothetical protein